MECHEGTEQHEADKALIEIIFVVEVAEFKDKRNGTEWKQYHAAAATKSLAGIP